jgi:hypothetical protein
MPSKYYDYSAALYADYNGYALTLYKHESDFEGKIVAIGEEFNKREISAELIFKHLQHFKEELPFAKNSFNQEASHKLSLHEVYYNESETLKWFFKLKGCSGLSTDISNIKDVFMKTRSFIKDEKIILTEDLRDELNRFKNPEEVNHRIYSLCVLAANVNTYINPMFYT